MKKVKQIKFNHPDLGVIAVNDSIPIEINETIGNVVEDYSKVIEYYHANIAPNNDGTFVITDLKLIAPFALNIGWFKNSKGNKNFITVISNRSVSSNIIAYPASIHSVIYHD